MNTDAKSTTPIDLRQSSLRLPDTAITPDMTDVTVSLDPALLTSKDLRASIVIDFSPDGGVTWASTSRGADMDPFPVMVGFVGGQFVAARDENGVIITDELPERGALGRLVHQDGVPLALDKTSLDAPPKPLDAITWSGALREAHRNALAPLLRVTVVSHDGRCVTAATIETKAGRGG